MSDQPLTDATDVADTIKQAATPEAASRATRVQDILDERAARREADQIENPPQAIPQSMSLADRFTLKRSPVKWRIEKVMKIGQRVIISAQFKAGKTTLVVNIVRALADGVNFLDAFEVSPANLVTVLDFEMAEDEPNLLDEWYQANGIKRTGHVHVKALRGRGSSFNILDTTVRSRWAHDLQGTTVLIVDCLRPILDALGLDENKDAGKFFTAFDALLDEAKIREAIIVHHMGHQHERSRGDSRILDYPDVIWTLVRATEDPASPRFFKAFGRGVDLPETALSYNPTNHRMGLGKGSRHNAKALAALPDVLDALRQHGPLTQADIEKVVRGHKRQAVRDAVDLGLDEKTIDQQKKPGKGGGWVYSAVVQSTPPVAPPPDDF